MSLPILRRGASSLPVRRTPGQAPFGLISGLDPWNDFAQMDRLFDNFFGRPFLQNAPNTESQVEMYETGDDLCVYLYAPGIAQDTLDISVTTNSLSIKGERKPLLEPTEGVLTHTPWSSRAIGTETFQVSYQLPVEVDAAGAKADYKDGVLQLHLPKSEAAKPKQVKIPLQNS